MGWRIASTHIGYHVARYFPAEPLLVWESLPIPPREQSSLLTIAQQKNSRSCFFIAGDVVGCWNKIC